MSGLSAFDRRSAILAYVREHERASTRLLSGLFGVSEVTLRSDLAILEESGHLVRTHGGAEVARPFQPEQPFAERQRIHLLEKAEIARAAAQMIEAGDHIILDASTTAFQLARELKDRRELTVITNNLQAAILLSENPAIDVIVLGGQLRGGIWSVVGPLAEEMLARLHVRRVFFGAAGLTVERGLTDANVREAQIKRGMLAAASEVVVLLDSSKFGQRALVTFAEFGAIDCLITDHGIPAAYEEACRQYDIQLTKV
jgi:DeoR family transcriptional regulator, aga operon transcriptional repressor